jgi:apolipoprotein N-acyltransferase
MPAMSDRELLAALTTIFLPLLVAVVQRPTWSDRRRAVVGFVAVFLWTLLGLIYVGDGLPTAVDWRAWVRLLLTNALMTYTAYQHLWKPLGWVQRMEAMTSPPSVARNGLLREAERRERAPRLPMGLDEMEDRRW